MDRRGATFIEGKKINLLPPGAELEGRLRQRFKVQERVVEIEGRNLCLIHPSDIDGLIHKAKEEDELPFWAYLWPASIALARFLLQSAPQSLAVKTPITVHRSPITALELGSGVGLAGIAAAMSGWEVVQTDLVPDALRFARVNALRNGLNIPGFVGDWRSFSLEKQFDVILGSDVLYEPTLHPALAQLVRRYLSPGGRLLISDPCRVYALQFMANLEDKGWAVRVEDAPGPVINETPVLIYTATLPQASEGEDTA